MDYLNHFTEMWTLAMREFLYSAIPGDVLIFTPKLLTGTHFYARLFPDGSGALVAESDRYRQALLYEELAHKCFEDAQRSIPVKLH